MRLPASILHELTQALNNPRVATALAGAGGGAAAGGAYGIIDSEAPAGPLGSAALGAGIGAAGLPYLLRNSMDDIARSMSQAGAAPREALDGLTPQALARALNRPPAQWEAEARAGSSVARANIDSWRNNETLKTALARRLQNERARANEPDFIQQEDGSFPLWNRHTMQTILDGELTPDSTIMPRGDYLLAGGTGDARAVRRLLRLNDQQVNGAQAGQTATRTETALEQTIPTDPRDMSAVGRMVERWRQAGINLTPGKAQLIIMHRAGASVDEMANLSRYGDPSVTLSQTRRQLRKLGLDDQQLIPSGSRQPSQLVPAIIAYLQRTIRSGGSFPSSKQIAQAVHSTEGAVNMTLSQIRSGGASYKGRSEALVAHRDTLAELERRAPRRGAGPTQHGPNARGALPAGEQKQLITEMVERRLNNEEILAEINALRAARNLSPTTLATVQTMTSVIRRARREAGLPPIAPLNELKRGGYRSGGGRPKRRRTSDALLALLGLSAAGGGLSTVNNEEVRRAILGRLQERI